MTSFENEATRIINKFHGLNLNLWKFKINILLGSMNLWNIMDGPEKTPPSDVDPKVLRDYQRCVKKTMSIIGLTLVDNQPTHIKSCKRHAEVCKPFFNINLRNLRGIEKPVLSP
jgi:hypothetical protein